MKIGIATEDESIGVVAQCRETDTADKRIDVETAVGFGPAARRVLRASGIACALALAFSAAWAAAAHSAVRAGELPAAVRAGELPTAVRAGEVQPAVVRAHPVAHAAPPGSKTWRSVPPGPHTLFGTIAALDGADVTVRLRSGRLAAVDATAAFANGAYSAPLFVGKMVAVDGVVHNGTFVAAHIVRLTNLADFPPDH
jgi:hypothetical protein